MQYLANMSRFLILICYCIGAIIANPLENVKVARNPRVIGGSPIAIEYAPYQVAILQRNGQEETVICGGTILTKNLVLTAAHCMELGPEYYLVHAGSPYSNIEFGWTHRVVKTIKHEKFYNDAQSNRPNNDIAIVKVKPEFLLDGVKMRPVILANEYDIVKPGDDAYLSGWGYINKSGVQPKILQGLLLKIMNLEECSRLHKPLGRMSEYNICAVDPAGVRDFCNGDSGGPLVVNDKQVGIVSWSGFDCAVPGQPGVYTDVAHYRQWIDQHMNI